MIQITTRDISDIRLYERPSGRRTGKKLRTLAFDCPHASSHKEQVASKVAEALDALVQVHLFRDQIRTFLPKRGSTERSLLKLLVTDQTIKVDKLAKGGGRVEHSLEIAIDSLEDSEEKDRIVEICDRLLKDVNSIYTQCQGKRRHFSQPSLTRKGISRLGTRARVPASPAHLATPTATDSFPISSRTAVSRKSALATGEEGSIKPPTRKGGKRPRALPAQGSALPYTMPRIAMKGSKWEKMRKDLHSLSRDLKRVSGQLAGSRKKESLDRLRLRTLHTRLAKTKTSFRSANSTLKSSLAEAKAQNGALRRELQDRESYLMAARHTQEEIDAWAAAALLSKHLLPISSLEQILEFARMIEEQAVLLEAQKDYYRRLPETIKGDIAFNLYQIINPDPISDEDRWDLGTRLFLEDDHAGLKTSNAERAAAIRVAVMNQLAAHYEASFLIPEKIKTENPPIKPYSMLPERDREKIETQLWMLDGQPKDKGAYYGHDAFFAINGQNASDVARSEAIRRHSLETIRTYKRDAA